MSDALVHDLLMAIENTLLNFRFISPDVLEDYLKEFKRLLESVEASMTALKISVDKLQKQSLEIIEEGKTTNLKLTDVNVNLSELRTELLAVGDLVETLIEQGTASQATLDTLVSQGTAAATARVKTNDTLDLILKAIQHGVGPDLKPIERSLTAIESSTAATATSTAAGAASAALVATELETEILPIVTVTSGATTSMATQLLAMQTHINAIETASKTTASQVTAAAASALATSNNTKQLPSTQSTLVTHAKACALNTGSTASTLTMTNLKLDSIDSDLVFQVQIYNNVVGIAATQNEIVKILKGGGTGGLLREIRLIKTALRSGDEADAARVVGYQQLIHSFLDSVIRPVPTTNNSLVIVGGDIAWHTAQDPEGNLRHVLPVKTF